MPFFAFCIVGLVGLLPEQWKITRDVRVVTNFNYFEKEIAIWHQVELEKLDLDFRMQQASLRLIAAQEEARAKGIGPSDPRYPDILDFYPLPEIKHLI
jgi:hypothetical protein